MSDERQSNVECRDGKKEEKGEFIGQYIVTGLCVWPGYNLRYWRGLLLRRNGCLNLLEGSWARFRGFSDQVGGRNGPGWRPLDRGVG